MGSGSVPLARNDVVLGPMAGVTEAPFRAICKRMGAGLTFTEMVSARGLHHAPDSAAARALLTFAPEEIPCAVQLFGSEPDIMAAQAARVAERHAGSVAVIDVNMGCPVNKVVSKGEGSALMRTPELAAEIVSAIDAAVNLPVSVKFRSGWDADEVTAVEFARAMEAAGASMLTVHGRTREQLYHGRADWDVIARVKEAVGVPVVGSGDVFSADDAVAMFAHTGVDAVMVARGAQGNPWIFAQARALLDTGESLPEPSFAERIEVAREHAAAVIALSGRHAVSRMRKHVVWYTAGMPGATHVRARVFGCETPEQLDALLAEYRDYLAARETAPEPERVSGR